jgi:hypothetical protein
MARPFRKRYPTRNGKVVIEIRVNSVHQLFDERDPAPFREKDLEEDMVEYLVTAIQEVGNDRLGLIRVYLGPNRGSYNDEMIAQAFTTHFEYEAEIMSRKITYTIQVGLKSLAIGLSFLSAAVFTSRTLGSTNPNYWSLLFKEGILLMGWVSMWKPINIFLYDWWPLIDLRKNYLQLAHAPLEIVNES